MKKTLEVLLFSLLVAVGVQAKGDSISVYQGFSGGMMLHAGYLFGQNANSPLGEKRLQGAAFGIGGALRVNLWDHLRVGGEGVVSTMNFSTTNYRSDLASGSSVRTGWGGLSADACWRLEKVWPYIGGAIGGGAMRSLYILDGNEDDWIEEEHSVFHKESFFFVDPYIGLDWCATSKVHVIFRIDWMLALRKSEIVYPTGPRLCVGFMFCH